MGREILHRSVLMYCLKMPTSAQIAPIFDHIDGISLKNIPNVNRAVFIPASHEHIYKTRNRH